MNIFFKQDAYDNQIWHEYLCIDDSKQYKSSIHANSLDYFLKELFETNISVDMITDPEGANCTEFIISYSEDGISFSCV